MNTPKNHGVTFEPDGSATFRVWAPKTEALILRVDDRDVPMTRRVDGTFEANAAVSRTSRYAYVFPDGRVRPDPASRRQPEGVHAPSQPFDPSASSSTETVWNGIPLEAYVFYELHVGTFTGEGTFAAAAERLPELAALGVTCVELLPVQPFPGSRNWGYDGVAPYGVQESYGGPEGLLRFVDRAHREGLAVCLDVVFNHLGPEGNYLRDFGPYFTDRHDTPWGEAMNYDGDESGPVRGFAVGAAVQWIRDFGVDALRLDAVHAIVDDSPTHLVAELVEAVEEAARARGRDAYVILESDLNERRLVEPRPEGWGAHASWADDLHHALHALLTGERGSFYVDFGEPGKIARALEEGFVYQGEQSRFRGRPHGTPTKGLPPTAFVTCSQNHDQVGNRPHGERLTELLPFEALAPIAATVILGPALPLLFMGEEYGEPRPFLYFTDHSDPELARNVTEGRKREFIAAGGEGEAPDPQARETFERSTLQHRREGRHGELRATYQRLLAIRARHRETLARTWPRVTTEGRCLTVSHPGLVLRVNLGPEAAGGLEAWGWEVTEG